MKKILYVCFFTFLSLFFISCGSEVVLKTTSNGCEFIFNISLEDSYLIKVFSLNTNSSDDGTTNIFDVEGIKKTLIESGLENVDVKEVSSSRLLISGFISKNTKNFITDSKIVDFYGDNNVKIVLSSVTLKNLYDNLSYELKSYLDMIAAPSFTGEQMTDDDYIEFIGTIYGEDFSNELNKSKVKFIIQNINGNKIVKEISLLKLLNIVGKLEI